MLKKGHKKIKRRIEDDFKKFLDLRGIEYIYVHYCDDSLKYNNYKTFYDKNLVICFDYGTKNHKKKIWLETGWEDEKEGGYYDTLEKINQWATFKNIKENEEMILKDIKKALENFQKYNRKLEELVKFRDSLNYFAK